MAKAQLSKEDKSLGDLFSELAAESGTLVRQEVALARAEVTQTAVQAGTNVGHLVVSGAVAYAGVLAILAAVIIGLANFMPAWLSALLVGAATATIAYFMISSSLTELKKMRTMPTNTIETIKEDVQWLKKEMT